MQTAMLDLKWLMSSLTSSYPPLTYTSTIVPPLNPGQASIPDVLGEVALSFLDSLALLGVRGVWTSERKCLPEWTSSATSVTSCSI